MQADNAATIDPRRAKLPKWAQREITRLECDLAYAKDKLAAGPEDSRVFADPYSDPPRPLGHDTSIDFVLGEKWGDKINVRIDGNGIKVVGGNRLAVIPNASNVVYIETVKS